MKVKVNVYGKDEIVDATADFWLKILTALTEAAEYNESLGFSATSREYMKMHDKIFEQTKKEVLKMEA